MLKPLIHLNYPYDKKKLLSEAEMARSISEPWQGSYKFRSENWKVSYYNSEYAQKIMKDLNVKGTIRFYYQEPNYFLPPHVDDGTKCAINFILSDNPAPINIKGVNYFYKQALINVQERHAVQNNNEERVLFKISIFNDDYEKVAKYINFKLNTEE